MSKLIEGLNRIYEQFAKYTPHRVYDLKPGLSLKEIEQQNINIPFKLSSKIYELYRWHNGSSGWEFLFENYEFLSLERAIYEYNQEFKQVRADLTLSFIWA